MNFYMLVHYIESNNGNKINITIQYKLILNNIYIYRISIFVTIHIFFKNASIFVKQSNIFNKNFSPFLLSIINFCIKVNLFIYLSIWFQIENELFLFVNFWKMVDCIFIQFDIHLFLRNKLLLKIFRTFE